MCLLMNTLWISILDCSDVEWIPDAPQNMFAKNGTVWANCGASQFHLPFGQIAQVSAWKRGIAI